EGDDVGTGSTYSTVWTKCQTWGDAGVVVVKSIERVDKLFAVQIATGSRQSFHEDFGGGERRELSGSVARRDFVFLLQGAKFCRSLAAHVGWHRRKSEKDSVFRLRLRDG